MPCDTVCLRFRHWPSPESSPWPSFQSQTPLACPLLSTITTLHVQSHPQNIVGVVLVKELVLAEMDGHKRIKDMRIREVPCLRCTSGPGARKGFCWGSWSKGWANTGLNKTVSMDGHIVHAARTSHTTLRCPPLPGSGRSDIPLYDVLKIFRTGKSHMACLTKVTGKLEELLGEQGGWKVMWTCGFHMYLAEEVDELGSVNYNPLSFQTCGGPGVGASCPSLTHSACPTPCHQHRRDLSHSRAGQSAW